jgi:GMP synthase (glutamine-hydrolysing)
VTPRLLVVQHEDTCPPGLLGAWLAEADVALEVVRAHRGDPLPESLGQQDGLVVLGGEMGALDDDVAPWLPQVRRLVASTVEAGRPFLGVCLGHQLAAAGLGGTVTRNPAGHSQGVTPFRHTGQGADDPLLSSVAPGSPVVQWNNDIVVALPPGAESLATSPDGSVQAARFGPLAWGVQCHPEATPAIFRGWTVEKPSAARLAEVGIDIHAAARVVAERAPEMEAAWAPFGHRFAAVVREHTHS